MNGSREESNMTRFEQVKKELRTLALVSIGLAVAYITISAFVIGLAHMWEGTFV